MMGTKRGLKRKDLINRVAMLEYALSNYIEMNEDGKKFKKFLEKKKEDGEHKQEKRK